MGRGFFFPIQGLSSGDRSTIGIVGVIGILRHHP